MEKGSGPLRVPAEGAGHAGLRRHLLAQAGLAVHLHQGQQRARRMRRLLQARRLRTDPHRHPRRRSLARAEQSGTTISATTS